MTESFRRKLRVTPEEEDIICKEMEELFRGLFETSVQEFVFKHVDMLMNEPSDSIHSNTITYTQTSDLYTIRAILGKIRRPEINKGS